MAAETFGENTIVIDLGLDRGEPETYARPTRRTVAPWFAPVLIALLVLVVAGGSAAPPAPALSPLLTLRVGPADTYALTDNNELLAQTQGTLAAYDLATGTERWQIASDRPTYRLRAANGLVLMRPWTSYGPGRPNTTALSLATGLTRWRHDGTVMNLTGSDALLGVFAVRSGGTNRRVQGPVQSLQPVDGTVLWEVQVPGTAVLLGVPGPGDAGPRMMLVHDNRTAAVHDLATGQKLASAELPAANYGPENPAVSGGVVLLRHLGRYGVMISAYDPVTLQRLWQRSADTAYEVRDCGPVACLNSPDGVRGIDPATGAERWYRAGWRGVEQRGAMTLAYGTANGGADPVGIVDPSTGNVLSDLHGWRIVGGTDGDRLLVTRDVAAGARTMVAVAEPGLPGPRPLADLPPGTGDCQAAPGRLVCRSASGELVVWAYTLKE
ncbi:PQQ-binding-like beta-propeller repeat protein [Actinoplanes sp. NPDC049265]|uniref:outer membrane protein assembly factor BamB family protein n=1 Tax=Actinoplanes sp. NPDC049265 TaxID=3363902 RepID=UPI00372299B3